MVERSEELEREALARIHSYSNLFLRQVTMMIVMVVVVLLLEMLLKVLMIRMMLKVLLVFDQRSHLGESGSA